MAKVAPKILFRARALRRKLTPAETILWSHLRREVHGVRFRRQHPIGSYIGDFACIRALLVVEVDGATHSSSAELDYDARRDGFMRSRGWHVMRVWNSAVYESLADTVDHIRDVALSRLGKYDT